ncbi:MAG: hypothetical protein B6U94_04295 [Thermofilum sp. ex4484_79]|nr:MAG: hypothetical protein B6U94_04295 [Thermofilum sp. ex4484_79]
MYIGYTLVGPVAERLEEKFKHFKAIYVKAGFEYPFRVYLANMLLFTIVSIPITFVLFTLIHLYLIRLNLFFSIIASLPITIASTLIIFSLLLYYPVYKCYSRKTKIDASLPFTIAYMASLASAGLGVERIIERSVFVEENKEISRELALLYKDFKVLGFDTAIAIERAASRAPSTHLNVFFAGLKDTFITSGDLKSYTLFTAKRLISDKMTSLRGIINSLALIAEVYVTMIVAAPLMFIIMLTVMSLLGGGIFGLPPVLVIYLLIMIVIPASAVAILVVIDGILSKV